MVGLAARSAGLRGIVWVDKQHNLPLEPLPKPRDAMGREVDIWLCVPGAEPYATAAKGRALLVFTQPRDETVAMTPVEAVPIKGDRVISLYVALSSRLDLRGKPPLGELRFCEGAD